MLDSLVANDLDRRSKMESLISERIIDNIATKYLNAFCWYVNSHCNDEASATYFDVMKKEIRGFEEGKTIKVLEGIGKIAQEREPSKEDRICKFLDAAAKYYKNKILV